MKQLQNSSMRNFWMPFTSNRDFLENPRIIAKAEGAYLYDSNNNTIFDGASGLFCSPLGHCRQEITQAVAAQLETLDYMAPFQSAHTLSFEFSHKLAALLPKPLNHIFFSNSGSEAVDTAIKIAFAYHYAKGEGQRTRLVSRERAYHGVNMGGVSLSGMVKNRQAFGPGLPGVLHMRHTWQDGNQFQPGQAEEGASLANDLERIALNYGPDTIAACVVEPIAGSTGCLVPPAGYLQRLREICDHYGILLIFDEVITGFGRTGNAFAAETFGVTPDIMTMAKALTNAAQPMGATAVSDNVHDVIFTAAADKSIELFHGYTYSGHPAACAAGLATLDIFAKEKSFAKAAALSEHFIPAVFSLQDIPAISDIRGFGLLAGIDLVTSEAPGVVGLETQKKLYHNGLHVKATGDCLLLAPPFISTTSEIDQMVATLRETLAT